MTNSSRSRAGDAESRRTPGSRARRWLRIVLAAVVGVLVVGCSGAPAPRADADARLDALMALFERHDYFALRSRLAASPRSGVAAEDLLRAAVQAAFNDPARSNATLDGMEREGPALPDSLTPLFHRLRYRNHLRLHRYAGALDAARDLLALPELDSVLAADVRNTVRMLEVLQDDEPQRVVRRSESEIRRLPNTRVPVQIGDSARAYVLDTGANVSVLMRSEAEALGLRIREAGVEVGTVTDIHVTADIAVADRVRLGEVVLDGVVFLVLPDELLTFEGGRFTIPGIIGFPVIEAFGEIAFRGGRALHVPAEPSSAGMPNLALVSLTPLVRVGVFGETAICRLDTGAGATSFYAPFYRRHRDRVETLGRDTVFTTTGVGGSEETVAYLLPEVRLALGGATVTLTDIEVATEREAGTGWSALACNLGLDALRAVPEYVINFRAMTLTLRDSAAARR